MRLKARRGSREAIIAVAASILTAVYWMLRRGVGCVERGSDHFDWTRLARKLGELGFEISLTQRATVSS